MWRTARVITGVRPHNRATCWWRLALAALLSGGLLYGDSIIGNGSFENVTGIVPSWSQRDTNGLTDFVFDSICSPTVLCANGQYGVAGAPALPGWTVSGIVDLGETGYDGYWSAGDGAWSLELSGASPDGTSSASQTLTGLAPGAEYALTFDLSENTAYCYGSQRCNLEVTAGDVTWNYYLAGLYEHPMIFSTETILFIAQSEQVPVYFENETGVGGLPGGPVIDNIRLSGPAPPSGVAAEPPSGLLLLLGAGVTGIRLLWRRKAAWNRTAAAGF